MWSSIDLTLSTLDITLLNLLLQVSVFAGLVLFVSWRFKKRAVTRYSILYSGIVVLPLLSVFSLALSSNDQSWLSMPLPQPSEQQAPAFAFVSADQIYALDELIYSAAANNSGESATSDISMVSEVDIYSENLKLSLFSIVSVIWLAGLLVMVCGLLRSLHKIESISNNSLTPTSIQRETLRRIAEETGFNVSLHYRISSSVQGPMLAGIVRPVLLLPPSFVDSLNTQQLKDILTHEFAHVIRNDSLANFLQKLILAVFWFHPLVHLIDRSIDRSREEICDNHVLQNSKAYGYGETLLAVHDLRSATTNDVSKSPVALGVLSRHWKLEQRIAELLDNSRSQSVKLTTFKQSTLFSSVLFASIILAGCQLQAAENQTPEQRIAELERQSRTLQQQAEELEEQRLALQDKNRELEEQLQAIVQNRTQIRSQNLEEQSALIREQMSRSLAEIRSLLQSTEMESQLQDIRELTERILQDLQTKLGDDSEALVGEAATNAIAEVLNDVSNNTPNRIELLRHMGRLQIQLHAVQSAEESAPQPARRNLPPSRDSEILSDAMQTVLVDVQTLMSPEDPDRDPEWDLAKDRLDLHRDLYWEQMNGFEKATLLNFYTNYWLGVGNYTEARNTFEQILQLANLREDIQLRTLRSLGQLYAAEEQWQTSIDRFEAWRDASDSEDILVFKSLSYNNYQLERYEEAIPLWEQYMDLSRANGVELERDDYMYLNGLLFTLERFEDALELTKQMIVLFNHPTDWQNLRAIHANLGMVGPKTPGQEELDNTNANVNANQHVDYQQANTPAGTEYLPLNSVSPIYPPRAVERGIEGWVLVSFTVDEEGSVVDESIKEEDADPPSVFKRAAFRAAKQLVFEPRMENGEAIQTEDVQYLFNWRLNNDA